MSVAISALVSILSKRARSTFSTLPRRGSTAWLSRLRPCLALPPAELPSTMKISHLDGSRSWQSASLPGKRHAVQRALAPREFARLARGFAGRGRFDHLADDLLGIRRMFLEPAAQLLQHHAFDDGAHFGGDELVLRLRAEFGIRHLDRQHAGQAFAAIVAGQRDFLFFARCRDSSAYFVTTRVSAARKPARCVPPSRCGMLLVKHSMLS